MKSLWKMSLLLSFIFNFIYASNSVKEYQLKTDYNIRYLKNDVLELALTLPQNSRLLIHHDVPPVAYDYRNSNGELKRSSNGFYSKIEILSTPKGSSVSLKDVNAWINKGYNLFISSGFIPFEDKVIIDALNINAEPNTDYLNRFTREGRPLFSFTDYFKTRFPNTLNKYINPDDLPIYELEKSKKVLKELNRVANREIETKANLLFTNVADARRFSIIFEEQEIVQTFGAWSVAVKGTAPRHGFGNVPCAEFMSEVIRQAYQRAGYHFTVDFNHAKDNYLIWYNTAAVVNLANSLNKAGWIPWEAAKYRPITGAPMMHFKATTPGHAYMSAGLNGQFIMDNGSPLGRDLRVSVDKTVRLLYLTGVFFLPPGINPKPW